MPAKFIFTKFIPNKLKKLCTLRYQSLVHVGIVDLDGPLPCWPSNKPHNHGGTICRDSSMDVANQTTPPPGASLEGVGRGWFTRVLLSLTMRPRKKIISINNGYILVLLLDWSLLPQKWWHYISQAITPSQTSSPVSPPPGPSISGWLLCVSSLIGSRLRPRRDSFFIIFCCPNHHPNDGATSSHMLQPPRALSPTSFLQLSLISGWLLCVFIKFWP